MHLLSGRPGRSRQPGSSDEVLRHCSEVLTKPSSGDSLTWKRDRNLVLKYERPDAWDYLPRISVPTMIVRGSDSTLLTRPVAEKMAASIPGSRRDFPEGWRTLCVGRALQAGASGGRVAVHG